MEESTHRSNDVQIYLCHDRVDEQEQKQVEYPSLGIAPPQEMCSSFLKLV